MSEVDESVEPEDVSIDCTAPSVSYSIPEKIYLSENDETDESSSDEGKPQSIDSLCGLMVCCFLSTKMLIICECQL